MVAEEASQRSPSLARVSSSSSGFHCRQEGASSLFAFFWFLFIGFV